MAELALAALLAAAALVIGPPEGHTIVVVG